MFIIPFIYTKKQLSSITIHKFDILTIGGNEFWKEEIEVKSNIELYIEKILESNEIYLTKPIISNKDYYYCQVDSSKIDWSDYYYWKDIKDEQIFCWRTFYLFGNAPSFHWLPIINQKLGDIAYD